MDYAELLNRLDRKIRQVELDRKRAARGGGNRRRGYVDAIERVFWMCAEDILAAEAGAVSDDVLRVDIPGLVFAIAREQKWVWLPAVRRRTEIVLAGGRSYDPWRSAPLRDVSEDEKWRQRREQFLGIEWVRDLVEGAILRRDELLSHTPKADSIGAARRKERDEPIDPIKAERHALIAQLKADYTKAGRRFTKTLIWKEKDGLQHKNPEEFNRWQRNDTNTRPGTDAAVRRAVEKLRRKLSAPAPRGLNAVA